MDDLDALIRQAQGGDVDAFARIVQRFHHMAIAYSYARLGDFHLAEDAAQEAFVQAFFDLPRLQAPLAFAGWLRRILFKYCDRITRRRQRPTLSLDHALDLADPRSEPLQLVEQREVSAELSAAIDALPQRERESVLLFYLGGYAQGEIAAFLDVPVTTVRKRLQAARSRLRQQLAADQPGGAWPPTPSSLLPSAHQLQGRTVMANDTAFVQQITAAIAAVKSGDAKHLAALLDAHPGLVDARSADGRSLLGHLTDYPANIAAGPALVAMLVRSGADVDALALDTAQGETPLQWAVSANDVAVAAALLEAGAAVDGPAGDGRPLSQALFYGQRAAAELLVRRGARITLPSAAGLGRVDLIERCFDPQGRLLPEAGAHVPPVNQFEPSSAPEPRAELLAQALVYAAINAQLPAIEVLLRRGAAIDALPGGFDIRLTPLHWAVARDQPAAVAALLAHGADLSVRDPRHQATALQWAVYHHRQTIVELMRAHGAAGKTHENY